MSTGWWPELTFRLIHIQNYCHGFFHRLEVHFTKLDFPEFWVDVPSNSLHFGVRDHVRSRANLTRKFMSPFGLRKFEVWSCKVFPWEILGMFHQGAFFFQEFNTFLVDGWTNPTWKICESQNWGSFSPRFGVKMIHTFELPPPSFTTFSWNI